MENVQEALSLFLTHEVTEELICTIGFNRKSRSYDKPYYPLWESFRRFYLQGESAAIMEIHHATGQIKIGRCCAAFCSIPPPPKR